MIAATLLVIGGKVLDGEEVARAQANENEIATAGIQASAEDIKMESGLKTAITS